jgi:hypothetical protein
MNISTRANIFLLFIILGCAESVSAQKSGPINIKIFPDSIVNYISNHPVGINMDYFMDSDKYLKPKHRTVDALKAMGVKKQMAGAMDKVPHHSKNFTPGSKSLAM